MCKKFLLLIIVFFSCILTVFADTGYKFDGFICDNAGILTPKAKSAINGFLYDLQTKTGADIAVATVKSLDGRHVESVAIQIGRDFKVGSKDKNEGAVVLVAPNDRKVRIEVGYGLEGIINDAKAGRIIDEEMLPYFKNGDYTSGIVRGTYVLAEDIAAANGVTLDKSTKIPPPAGSDFDLSSFFLALAILYFLWRMNIFIVPVGGGFGGGGASRGW